MEYFLSHILFGRDPESGSRIMATEHVAELHLCSGLGLHARVEHVKPNGTVMQVLKSSADNHHEIALLDPRYPRLNKRS